VVQSATAPAALLGTGVLFLQDEIAERVLRLLSGYMDELVLGDPALLATDVGPVIDETARSSLEAHAEATARPVLGPHGLRAASGKGSGILGHVGLARPPGEIRRALFQKRAHTLGVVGGFSSLALQLTLQIELCRQSVSG
jgi:hypothetical protein